MYIKLLKQCLVCLLIVLALFISENSGINVLEKGSRFVINKMSVNYTEDDIIKNIKNAGSKIREIPQKASETFNRIVETDNYGEAIDSDCEDGKAVVYAVGSGQVTAVGDNEEIGKYIRITHGNENESLYGNLSEIYVKVPDRVKKGQIIALYRNNEDQGFYFNLYD